MYPLEYQVVDETLKYELGYVNLETGEFSLNDSFDTFEEASKEFHLCINSNSNSKDKDKWRPAVRLIAKTVTEKVSYVHLLGVLSTPIPAKKDSHNG